MSVGISLLTIQNFQNEMYLGVDDSGSVRGVSNAYQWVFARCIDAFGLPSTTFYILDGSSYQCLYGNYADGSLGLRSCSNNDNVFKQFGIQNAYGAINVVLTNSAVRGAAVRIENDNTVSLQSYTQPITNLDSDELSKFEWDTQAVSSNLVSSAPEMKRSSAPTTAIEEPSPTTTVTATDATDSAVTPGAEAPSETTSGSSSAETVTPGAGQPGSTTVPATTTPPSATQTSSSAETSAAATPTQQQSRGTSMKLKSVMLCMSIGIAFLASM
ncbi:hypothetical protein HII31_10834 [Pseudocercospora fuligena]|uniref:Uncharacterized protein n=1 Tax=Pseudocercospora fuligena TaxID=685502 RepID=A0A8H6VH59_9PEZI|nr:hypothetical protein HII31_10834 [Pseudocercospora fuligena]